jgi:DNA-binding beta-propeller fold protein YncE
MDVIWKGSALWVTDYQDARVSKIDPRQGRITQNIRAVPKPMGLALVPDIEMSVVCGYGRHEVAILGPGGDRHVLGSRRFPYYVDITSDGKVAVVGNLLPPGASTDPDVASFITLIDVSQKQKIKEIALPYGSTNVRQIRISPDDRWAFAAHTRGRVNLPTSQLERGWVNTNCLSVVDLKERRHYVTLLLDTVQRGAADPWGVAVSPDGQSVWVTLAGVHEIASLDFGLLGRYLSGESFPGHLRPSDAKAYLAWDVWGAIGKNPIERHRLENELSALYAAKVLTRTKLPCRGPRGIAVSPDGNVLALAGYFSSNVLLLDADNLAVKHDVRLGESAPLALSRRGQMIFHDAEKCFQHWLSCATCHPDGRADGLNWDLLNDGIGNPKNTKSLVLAHRTPPSMSTAARANFDVAVEAGFKHILMREPSGEQLSAVKAYLKSLKPESSPYLLARSLSKKARQGKLLFRSPRLGCAKCHQPPLYTDLKTADVGTKGPLDRAAAFDNPALLEIWRTGPYLHDGAAATLEAVLRQHNAGDRHGQTSHLTEGEVEALAAYLLSL